MLDTTIPLLEYEQCIVKLSARLCRVEKDLIRILQEQLELMLQQYTMTTTTTTTHQQQQLQLQNTEPTSTNEVVPSTTLDGTAAATDMDAHNSTENDNGSSTFGRTIWYYHATTTMLQMLREKRNLKDG
jgi:hypothetical protein